MSGTSSLMERTRRLLIISALLPAFVFGVVTVAMAAVARDTQNMLISAGTAVVLAGVGVWTWWGTRAKPNLWQSVVSFPGWVAAVIFVMMATGSGVEEELGWSETTFFVAVAVIAGGMALFGWLPARRAARLVLTDLSAEVGDSPLVVTFAARGTNAGTLTVTPESLEVVTGTSAARKSARAIPLSAVTGVAVRDDMLVVHLGDQQIEFAAVEARQAKEFVEARVRRWASAGQG